MKLLFIILLDLELVAVIAMSPTHHHHPLNFSEWNNIEISSHRNSISHLTPPPLIPNQTIPIQTKSYQGSRVLLVFKSRANSVFSNFVQTSFSLDVRSWSKYEEVLEIGGEGKGFESPKVQEFQGPRVPCPKDPWSKGPKDQDISKSHSNTSLTLKKVHLVSSSELMSLLSNVCQLIIC